jgi:ribosomal protein L37AE/L43A
MSTTDVPDCPHCSTALRPERINAERFVCTCCSREFTRDQVLTIQAAKK